MEITTIASAALSDHYLCNDECRETPEHYAVFAERYFIASPTVAIFSASSSGI
jgi:hypothetical protein